jgi:hypothetical protein
MLEMAVDLSAYDDSDSEMFAIQATPMFLFRGEPSP